MRCGQAGLWTGEDVMKVCVDDYFCQALDMKLALKSKYFTCNSKTFIDISVNRYDTLTDITSMDITLLHLETTDTFQI